MKRAVSAVTLGLLALTSINCSGQPRTETEGANSALTSPSQRFAVGAETRPGTPPGGTFNVGNAAWLSRAAEVAYEDREDQQRRRASLEGLIKELGGPALTITDYRYFDTTDDTQAAYIATDRVAFLAFRGTSDLTDVRTDLDFQTVGDGAVNIHRGFLRAFRGIWYGDTMKPGPDGKEGVASFLLRTKRTRAVPLYVTGHSLGAALATLAVRAALTDDIPVEALYTFGSPRVGDEAFAQEVAQRTRAAGTAAFRVVNYGDGVTVVPKLGLKHVSFGAEDEQEGNSRFIFLSETYGRYYTGTARGEHDFFDRTSAYLGDLFAGEITRHASAAYSCKLDRILGGTARCPGEEVDNDAAHPACVATAEAVARAAERCGQDYETNVKAFVESAAGGSCANVTRVRDEPALRARCLPSLASLSCDGLVSRQLDPSCIGQLQH